MEAVTLQAEVRKESGKGPARRLRMRGLVPAVFYGPGADTTPLAIPPKELIRALLSARGRNSIIKLAMPGGGQELALVKDVQVHPVSRALLHVDFYRVALDKPVVVEVPFRVTGRALGQQEGGRLNITLRTLPVRALPEQIPDELTVDVSPLVIGTGLQVKDIAVPPGAEILARPTMTVVTCTEERQPIEEEAAAAVPVEGAEGAPAEGEEGAPKAEGEEGAAAGDKPKRKGRDDDED
jgi:large subunit ribosomal protein L25